MSTNWVVSDNPTPPPAAGDWQVSDSATPPTAAAAKPAGPTWGSSADDVASTVGEHLKGLVTGPIQAVTHPYDTFVKPTVDAGGRAVSQFKQGRYADAARSAESAIPVVGPWADSIENEVGQKGAVAGMAGLATDVLAPKLAGAAVGKLPNAMQDSAAGIINRTVGSRKSDFARGANPGRGYLANGLGPSTSMDSIAEKAADAKNAVGGALADAYDQASKSGKVIPADDIRKAIHPIIDQAKTKASGPGVLANPDAYDELKSSFEPMLQQADAKGGMTPSELWSVRKNISDSLNWGDQTKATMTRTQQRVSGALGGLLEDAVPEVKDLNQHYQDLGKLAGRAKERAATHSSPLTGMVGKVGMTGVGAALGSGTPLGPLGGAAVAAAMDSVPGKTTLASGLNAGSRFLRPVAPVVRASSPAATLGAVAQHGLDQRDDDDDEHDTGQDAHGGILHETKTQDGKSSASAQVPSEVKALLDRTGAKVTNKEAPTSQSVASVDPDQPNTINIDDMERFNKDSNARNQTISHEAVHNWHQNLPPAIQKMIPLDNPKDLYGKDDKGYEQDDLKNMRGQGVKLWNLPKEKAAAVIQTYAHLGGDKAPKAVQDVYKPWAQDMVTSPLNPHGASADQPAEMHETKILGEDKPKKEKASESVPRGAKSGAGDVVGYDSEDGLPIIKRKGAEQSSEPAPKPEKEDTPDGKRDVLHASKDRDELVAEGKSHAPHLESGLKAAADSVPGAKLEGVRSEKDPDRLDEKIKREGQPVETVPDVLAGRISVDDDEAHKGVVDDIKKHATVVREKDEFKKGDSRFGFHSHKLQVKVSPKMSAEVQVVPKEVAANDKKQHPVYKQAREAELDGDTEKADLLAEKSKGMNEEAKSRFDKRNIEKEENNLDAKPVVERKSDSALHKVGDRVTLPGGKSATVAYAPSKGAQLPTYRFKGDDGSTTTMRASEAHSKVKKAPDDVPDGKEVAVDLDKTLSFTHGQTARTHIGAPQPEMVARIKKDLAAGKKVAIFTARVSNDPDGKVREAIQAWSKKHIGVALPVTDKKTEDVGEILDDKAKHVVPNKGKVMA